MTIKNNTRKVVALLVMSGLVGGSVAAYADGNTRLTAQNCSLGSECPIPGNDGGHTYFAISPANGMNYTCTVKSDGGSLKVLVKGGKDFSLTQGSGIYNANPDSVIKISGRFDKPNDPNDQGEIRFHKLPLSSDGSVTCSQDQ